VLEVRFASFVLALAPLLIQVYECEKEREKRGEREKNSERDKKERKVMREMKKEKVP
jgi:hypothetical protein